MVRASPVSALHPLWPGPTSQAPQPRQVGMHIALPTHVHMAFSVNSTCRLLCLGFPFSTEIPYPSCIGDFKERLSN